MAKKPHLIPNLSGQALFPRERIPTQPLLFNDLVSYKKFLKCWGCAGVSLHPLERD